MRVIKMTKKLPFDLGQQQRGTSFIELVIAMGLLSMITVLTASYLKKVSEDDKESRARDAVDSDSMLWIASIERDLTMRKLPANNAPFPALCPGSICRETIVDRFARHKTTNELQLFRVQYYSYCQGMPPQIKAKYEAKAGGGNYQLDFSASALNAKFGAGHKNVCMASINCPNGTYPQIVRTLINSANLKVPIYPNDRADDDGTPRSVLPQLGDYRSTSDRIIAAALCSSNSPNSTDRLMLEAAFLANDDTLRIKRLEISIPRKNLARAQLVPNED